MREGEWGDARQGREPSIRDRILGELELMGEGKLMGMLRVLKRL